MTYSTLIPSAIIRPLGEEHLRMFRRMTEEKGAVPKISLPKEAFRIIPTGKDAGWVTARKLVEDKGGLPSIFSLCENFRSYTKERIESENWGLLGDGVYSILFWAKEVMVYPKEGNKFKSNIDIVEQSNFGRKGKFIFPARYIPEKALGDTNTVLFVTPERVVFNSGKGVATIIPKEIRLLMRPEDPANWIWNGLKITGYTDEVGIRPLYCVWSEEGVRAGVYSQPSYRAKVTYEK